MSENSISSDESEGFFEDFMQDQLEELVEDIIKHGDIDRGDNDGSDLIVEMDDINPPTFTYGDGDGEGQAGQGPGSDGGKLKFDLPYDRFMALVSKKLRLPDLKKEGKGRIKAVSYSMNTFGPIGVVMDKKRTFKRALKTSIGTNAYNPSQGRYDFEVQRRDRRYKVPKREEKPKYKAVVFYVGDISYSTWGERLELEKRLLNFVHQWLDYNYGKNNVEHRYFVHDAEAYEVTADEFYQVGNVGGTQASMAFDLIAKVARNDYDLAQTNLYAFYVGDGELFMDDAKTIAQLAEEELRSIFTRLCITEVKPSTASILSNVLQEHFKFDDIIRMTKLNHREDIIKAIRVLLGKRHA